MRNQSWADAGRATMSKVKSASRERPCFFTDKSASGVQQAGLLRIEDAGGVRHGGIVWG